MRLYAMYPPLVTACLPDVPPPAQADAVGGAAGTNAEGAHWYFVQKHLTRSKGPCGLKLSNKDVLVQLL